MHISITYKIILKGKQKATKGNKKRHWKEIHKREIESFRNKKQTRMLLLIKAIMLFSNCEWQNKKVRIKIISYQKR